MDLRSTKSGLTKSIRRFRRTADVRTIGSFKGALEPEFNDWICNHWRFLGPRFIKPVPLNFRKPENPFELAGWPRLHPAKEVHYAFSPTIQLTFPFNPINNLLFETNTDSRFQWLLSEMSSQRPAGERLLTTPVAGAKTEPVTVKLIRTSCGQDPVWQTREFWASLRQLGDQPREAGREIEGMRTLLLVKERLAGTLASVPKSSKDAAASWSMVAPLFLTIARAAQHWTQSLKSSLIRSAVWPGQREQFRYGGIVKPERIPDFCRSIFHSSGLSWTRSPLQTLLKMVGPRDSPAPGQIFSTQLTVPGSRSGLLPSPGDSFTNLSLTLLAPKPAESEMTTRRIQSFGLPSNLSYARRDAPQLQAVVNALRDLRPSQTEMKTQAVPQLPSIEQLTGQIRQQLERDLRIERERRGL